MNKKTINEVTSTTGSGHYKNPITLAAKIWKNSDMGAFTIPVSDYLSAQLAYDSYDGHMDDYNKKEISKLEKKAEKQSKMAEKFFSQNDDEGNPFNGYSPMGNPLAGTPDSVYKKANLPKKELKPVIKNKNVSEGTNTNEKKKQKIMKNNIENKTGIQEKSKDGSYEIEKHDTINEDLGVWFGTKKKPKGSKQPKGPWVNICRRDENGKHPPCGRPGSSAQRVIQNVEQQVLLVKCQIHKKKPCAQKRKAEKKDTQTGKGQKPVMTSYKPKNESLRELIKTVLREQTT